ncbi:hypothetical protein HK414_18955 [Ramlibacter terrae]|uniref:DUF304 domain-containing protein n=1 Tax=Ramlibacter terrae TaxID=2732511 RepID=A0ABX6P6C4_9BURK|nr:hypothetical protein HK414_18955 [Ramlibacter terrae]
MNIDENLAEYVSHDDFRTGLPQGRFRVIVDPKLARGWVRQRLWLLPIVMAMIGAGLALALGGATWPGFGLVFAGVAVNRLVAWNAGKILLHLALRDRVIYDAATGGGIMEVRRV